MNPENTHEEPVRRTQLQPISDDMRDPEKIVEYQRPSIATTPVDIPTPPSNSTPNPLKALSDKEIDEITRKASRPDTRSIFIIITYYIATWLVLSNANSLYGILRLAADTKVNISSVIATGIMTPISIILAIIGILAGLGLFFFRDTARKVTMFYVALSLIFSLYALFALGSASNIRVFTSSFAYLFISIVFIPVNVILFLGYKPTKQLFH